jgi:diaminopimelate epimerase
MRQRFTKMQGAGNDFVVLDGTQSPVRLSQQQLQRLGDRRFGVGADQILAVEPARMPGIDFSYRIFNGASGEEVEHCGNGARCFLRYVRDKGLTTQDRVRVQTVNRVLELLMQPDGRVTVDMGEPVFEPGRVPFVPGSLQPVATVAGPSEALDLLRLCPLWPLHGEQVAVLSMGNPHAVLRVANTETAPVATLGPALEHDPHFPQRVNVGFVQPLSSTEARLRVFERDAGETLACGTGACAAVVAGICRGWLGPAVEVHTRGGRLLIEWGGPGTTVRMTGPAQSVFEGEIEL